ncbi:glycine oxidase maturase GoxB [Thalassobaculum sp.]|uniref:glycine oxidase maturase GoxB n=1 Tax=Thalassobaculum sp. TaxID=2022740 RepID=UPI0032F062F9
MAAANGAVAVTAANPSRLSAKPVVVAGAGISGAAACVTLARQGLSVVWLAPEPATPWKPGESLAAAAGPLLESFGAAGILDKPAHRRMETSFSCWGSDALLERSAIASRGGLGTAIDRSAFEADLRDLAAEAGCRIVCAELADFARSESGWVLRTGDGQELDAGFLVDATGRSAFVGRRMTTMHRRDQLVAAVAFLQQVETDVDPTPATVIEAVQDGWWYASLLANGSLAVNYYTDPDLLARGLTRDVEAWKRLIAESRYISRWIATGGFGVAQAPQLASAGSTWLERAAGPGWIAVGDAAAAFDPLSAHGMTTALWTGIEAAKAIRRVRDGETAALDAYSARVAAGVERFLADQIGIYGREVRFRKNTFWSRRVVRNPNANAAASSVDEDRSVA